MLLIQIWNRRPIGRDQSDALPRALADAAHRTLVRPPQTLLDLRARTTAEVVVCDGGSGAETAVDMDAPIVLIAEYIGDASLHVHSSALARALGEAAQSVVGKQRLVHVLIRRTHPKTDAYWSG